MADRQIITDNTTFFQVYEQLVAGDIVVGRIRLRQGEEHLLLDLAVRGIEVIPSAVSQICSRSKVFQARLLGGFMIPGTEAVYDQHDMMRIITHYGEMGVEEVVVKLDRANGGIGILRFRSVEEVYTQTVLSVLRYPFVLQPFLKDCADIRVVVLGDQVEAYQRHNPYNFRHNLHCGGSGSVWKLSDGQRELCSQVMQRANFPYAHVDLMCSDQGGTWLTEINLRGGLRGAQLNQQDYIKQTEKIHAQLLAALEK